MCVCLFKVCEWHSYCSLMNQFFNYCGKKLSYNKNNSTSLSGCHLDKVSQCVPKYFLAVNRLFMFYYCLTTVLSIKYYGIIIFSWLQKWGLHICSHPFSPLFLLHSLFITCSCQVLSFINIILLLLLLV